MAKRKRNSAQTNEPIEIKESHCVWSLADKSILIVYISSQQAKYDNRMNFDKTFWVTAAAEMAAKGTGVGAAKSPDACNQKWEWIHNMFKVINKIANSSRITHTCEKGGNITAESETIWADLLKSALPSQFLSHGLWLLVSGSETHPTTPGDAQTTWDVKADKAAGELHLAY
ncbi:hypothetical protein DFH29DRAFT_995081 [Suillus ampliporus]|nr:hypothetical protein DFH29DRAFT_995081 [Suillus ampliporus]